MCGRFSVGWFIGGMICLLVSLQASVLKSRDPNRISEITYRYPVITLPQMAGAIEVDGKLDAREWQICTKQPLVDLYSGRLSDRSLVLQLAYSDKGIHVGVRSEYPQVMKYRGQIDQQREILHIEVKDQFAQRSSYQFVLEQTGKTRAYAPSLGEKRPISDGDWVASALTGKKDVTYEVTLPFDTFRRQVPEPGTTWEILVWLEYGQGLRTLVGSSVLPQSGSREFAYLNFGGKDAPCLWLSSAGNVSSTETGLILEGSRGIGAASAVKVVGECYMPQRADLNFFEAFDGSVQPANAMDPADRLVSASQAMASTTKGFKPQPPVSQTLELRSGALQSARFLRPAVDGVGLVHVRVLDAKTEMIVAAWSMLVDKPDALRVDATILVGERQQVAVDTSFVYAGELIEGTRVQAALKRDGNRMLVARQVEADLMGRTARIELPLEGIEPGEVNLEVALMDGQEVLQSRSRKLTIPALPRWVDQDYGQPESLSNALFPFRELRMVGSELETSFVTYTFADTAMPVSIKLNHGDQQVDLLAEPIRLVVNSGRSLLFGPPKVISRNRWAVTMHADVMTMGTGTSGTLQIVAEADGFIRYSLTIAPMGDRAVDLSEVTLEIPLKASLVSHYRAALQNSMAYGQHGDWSGGRYRGQSIELPFSGIVWAGSQVGGMEVSMESDRFWSPLDRPDAITLKADADKVVMQYAIVTRAQPGKPNVKTAGSGAITFTWGMMPTPVRPIAIGGGARYRLVRDSVRVHPMTHSISSHSLAGEARNLAKLGGNGLLLDSQRNSSRDNTLLWHESGPIPGPLAKMDESNWRIMGVQQWARAMQSAGMRYRGYDALATLPVEDDVIQPFLAECVAWPVRGSEGYYAHRPGRLTNAWIVSRIHEMLTMTGASSVVLDQTVAPALTARLSTGDGWVDTNGRLRGRYPIFANRDLHRRIWTLVHRHAGRDGLVITRSSPFPIATIESLSDLHEDGGNVDLLKLAERDLDDFKIRFDAHLTGIPLHVVSDRLLATRRSQIRGLVYAMGGELSGVSAASAMRNASRTYEGESDMQAFLWPLFKQLDDLALPAVGPSGEKVDVISSTDDRLLIRSVYGKSLIVLCNTSGDSLSAELEFDWHAAGFRVAPVVVDAVTGLPFMISGDPGKATLNLEGHDWRLLLLRQK